MDNASLGAHHSPQWARHFTERKNFRRNPARFTASGTENSSVVLGGKMFLNVLE
jgi:hypothetical protein